MNLNEFKERIFKEKPEVKSEYEALAENVSIVEFIDALYTDTTRKFEDLVWAAFYSLGYTKEWVMSNSNRITIDRITWSGFDESLIYKLDGIVIFIVGQTTKFVNDGNSYKFVADWQIDLWDQPIGREDD